MTIQYRKSDGSLGSFDSDKFYSTTVNNETKSFNIKLKCYGWDEYDYWYEDIIDVIEIRI